MKNWQFYTILILLYCILTKGNTDIIDLVVDAMITLGLTICAFNNWLDDK